MEYTFSLVDLAGFTAATSAHGDEAGADLAVRLAVLAAGAVSHQDAIVKSMGDAVLCVSTAPHDGVEWIVRLLAAVDPEPGFPLLRCGVSHGPAVERAGDFFGTSVNVPAQEMIVHHAQAVDMADIALERTQNAEIRQLATAIKSAQDPEIQQMSTWLAEWGQSVPDPNATMTMDGMGDMTSGTMMTEAEMSSLGNASDAEFDQMF